MSIHFPTIITTRPDGVIMARPGKPIVDDELTTAQFAKLSKMAQRTVQDLCDHGKLKCRRLTNKPTSKILIPASELEQFKTQPA